MSRIAVIGTGNMGPGIAWCFARAGCAVSLIAATAAHQSEARSALADLADSLPGSDDTERIAVGADLVAGVRDADLVLEAIPEDLAAKRSIFAALADSVRPDAILATTSSALSIDELVNVGVRPRAIGLHFFFPPAVIPVVEVIPGAATSEATILTAVGLLRAAGKNPIRLSRYIAGFVGNRLLHAMIHEAITLVREGIATPADIDAVVRGAFTLRQTLVGPLETADLVGLDLIARVQAEVLPALDGDRHPDPLLLELVRSGDLGAKSGRGFYDWTSSEVAARRRTLVRGISTVIRAVEAVWPELAVTAPGSRVFERLGPRAIQPK